MFTVGPVDAWDHGLGCSIVGVWNWPQGLQEGLMGCPFQDGTKKEGASAFLNHLEALRLNRKFLLHNIPNTTVNTNIY